ncbi:MAG: hypothetical protein ABIH99_05725 [Candidatus Micrarchaeota archaeon]
MATNKQAIPKTKDGLITHLRGLPSEKVFGLLDRYDRAFFRIDKKLAITLSKDETSGKINVFETESHGSKFLFALPKSETILKK